MKALVLAILSLALTAPVKAQWLNYPTPGIPRTADGKPNVAAPTPRTADGKPDLTGVWNRVSPKYGANIAADLKPGDVQPWAQTLVDQRKENLGRDHMTVHCLPLGPGYSTAQRYVKIVQTPTLIVMLDEDLTYRQIYLDGRPLEKDPQPAWMGYSVGRWDGDTLVVESSGFNDKTWLDTDGHPHTEALAYDGTLPPPRLRPPGNGIDDPRLQGICQALQGDDQFAARSRYRIAGSRLQRKQQESGALGRQGF